MATETRGAPINGVWGETLALTTTITGLHKPPGRNGQACRGAILYSANAFRYQITPPVTGVFKTADAGATFTDYTTNAIDRNTATLVTLSSLDTLANGDSVYIVSPVKFGGIVVDIGSANGSAATLAAYYPDWGAELNSSTLSIGTTYIITATETNHFYGNCAINDIFVAKWETTLDASNKVKALTYTDISATDGTASGGACLAVDGNITWTMPTTWLEYSINGLKGFIIRLSVSAAMDSSTTIRELSLLPPDSVAGYGEAAVSYELGFGSNQGGISAYVASGTGTLDLTWIFG
jgi:hypothetical protein